MKFLAAVFLAFLPSFVMAEGSEAAGFQNNMGGWTVITSREQYCGALSMYDGYAFGSGHYVRFCWVKKGNAILALLENNDTSIWPIVAFEVLEKEPEIDMNKS